MSDRLLASIFIFKYKIFKYLYYAIKNIEAKIGKTLFYNSKNG